MHVRLFIVHTRRAGRVVTRPPNCGVMRKVTLVSLIAAAASSAAQSDDPAPCESGFRANYQELLALTPPRTEYLPSGSVVVAFTVQPDGAVSDVSFAEWGIRPSDDFMRNYLIESVRKWRFPARESPCRGTQKLTFKLNEDA